MDSDNIYYLMVYIISWCVLNTLMTHIPEHYQSAPLVLRPDVYIFDLVLLFWECKYWVVCGLSPAGGVVCVWMQLFNLKSSSLWCWLPNQQLISVISFG